MVKTMSNINMAISPRGNIFSFYFFFFTFFSLLFLTPAPPYCVWRLIIDKKNILYFVWNNIVLAKNKKEERTYNINSYLNLLSKERMRRDHEQHPYRSSR